MAVYVTLKYLKIVANRKERSRKSVLEIIRIKLLVTSTVNILIKSTAIVSVHSFQKTQKKVFINLRRCGAFSQARIIKIIQQTI